MSRVGKQPVALPSGVKASVREGAIEVEGPKGKVSIPLLAFIKAEMKENELVVTTESNTRQAKANWGTQRALVRNAVIGVTEQWTKNLELQGVGFTAAMKGNVITLATGYSHKSDVEIPQGVSAQVEKQSISLASNDRNLLGQVAATLRDVCPPEPYLGKGVRYQNESVRRKAGKTGAK
ncbi:MAG: 50S ribosomal protein L6 [Bdellovibrionales bacterium]|nr:50S ribosomal protein L6 [Bdellovibrionales bacterium]